MIKSNCNYITNLDSNTCHYAEFPYCSGKSWTKYLMLLISVVVPYDVVTKWMIDGLQNALRRY
jgi:hypothetical protein